ncbi:MAG: DNA polymerase III subunit delta [Bacteroidota bacterium]|nr:DNA polymerase III subunit delta [Bacteroidota bacterium]MDX5428262.1 DNA polymerase III subunit delta [Bacteroidota bacterium]MDX5447368.1 DNA polymerase III subunit delta [Bacteroidota bacterium]MDX5506043.1 DNA polymerase III subunit delta [Bacteroidota bacterium]
MMSFEELEKELKARQFRPLYWFAGEESFFIDRLVDIIEKTALNEAERSFNQTILYGKDTDVGTVIASAKRYPMMAPHNVVIVKEAQQLKKIEELNAYAENPLDSTILVLASKHKAPDKRTKFYKTVNSKHVFFESKRLYDNQVPGWIEKQLRLLHYKVSPKSVALLAEHVGSDLSKLYNEIEKLRIIVPEGGDITAEVIEKNVGISKDYNNFELTKALSQRDVVRSNEIIRYFAQNPKDHPLTVTIFTLYGFFSKLLILHTLNSTDQKVIASKLKVNPFFIREYQTAARNYSLQKVVRIIGYLRECDIRSKGIDNYGTSDADLMKELMFKILH